MARGDRANGDLDSIGRAIEMLLRLNASRRVQAEWAAAAGVPMSQPGFTLLRRIQDSGPLSLTELGRLTHMDAASVTRQVVQLERAGLVRRDRSESDGRIALLSVTPEGAEARARVSAVLDEHLANALAPWSGDDRGQLAGLLGRLVDDLRATRYQPAPGSDVVATR
ncbi:MAG: MarR family transcriptional regulator [Actinobacteria bacterium]|nr:MarR family transcriptional regulator [Actinomycetota bacterium]